MFQFPKKQKLCGSSVIDTLFEGGSSMAQNYIRVIWKFEKNNVDVNLKSIFIVPKKRINLAYKRNTIKRRMRESFRIHKKKLESLLENQNKQMNLAIIYNSQEIKYYNCIDEKINLILNRLIKEL